VGVTHYLVEFYLPRAAADNLAAIAGDAGAAVERSGLRLLQTIYLPEDEVCFHHFDRASELALVDSLTAGAVPFDRVIRAVVRP
jgi:hypothetical protein